MDKCKSSNKLHILITLLLLAGDVHLNPGPNMGNNISITTDAIESVSSVYNGLWLQREPAWLGTLTCRVHHRLMCFWSGVVPPMDWCVLRQRRGIDPA